MRAQSKLAEALVLALGGLAVLGLSWAGLRSWGDPESIARIELDKSADRAAQILQLTWERRASSPEAPLASEAWRGSRAGLETPEWPRAALPVPLSGDEYVLRAAMATAESMGERERIARALDSYPDLANRAEGWLRLIQMAAVDEDQDAVSEALGKATREIGGDVVRGDVSYLLLVHLAAAPALSAEQRAVSQATLVELWKAGGLVLPVPEDGWSESGEPLFDVRFEAWARAIEQLSSEHADEARLAASHASRGFRALYESLGSPQLPAGDGHWHRLGDGEWLARLDAEGGLLLCLADASALAASIEGEANLGTGFSLAGEGDESARMVRIAEREWPLRQPNLPELIAAEVASQSSLRLGFGLLLLFTLAATGVTLAALTKRRKLNALKSHFIAGVSHDLRTPLASILLMAENLESGRVSDPERQAQYHASIRREASRLGRLVDDVLDFSRIERGESAKLAKEDVPLGEFLAHLGEECVQRVAQKGGKLELRFGELPVAALLDPGAVQRAVGNLIDNALAHSGSTEFEFAASCDGADLVLEVADQGCGVPAQAQEALFDAFAQGESLNPAAGGTGLGLAIVRELARAHGGDAKFVDSEVGARIRFTIPMTVEDTGA